MPSTEYEPPNPRQDYNFEHFQEVNSDLVSSNQEILSDPSEQNEQQSSFSSFYENNDELLNNDSVYFSPSVKKFENPSGFSFKTVPKSEKLFSYEENLPESVVTELPKFTYSVKSVETSTSVNAFINFGENSPKSEDTVPKFTYKLIQG